MSTTRAVSIREFREHMTAFLHEAQESNVHFVIMRHAKPVAHIVPVSQADSLEELTADIARARKEAKKGTTFSPSEVRKLLNL